MGLNLHRPTEVWFLLAARTAENQTSCGRIWQPLPRDSAPKRSRLEKVAVSNALRAAWKRSTILVIELFDRKEGSTVSRLIQRCAHQSIGYGSNA